MMWWCAGSTHRYNIDIPRPLHRLIVSKMLYGVGRLYLGVVCVFHRETVMRNVLEKTPSTNTKLHFNLILSWDKTLNSTKMYLKKLYTLVFLRTDTHILLGFKKRGFGVNKWNGFGGKVEQNESIIDAAIRELKEECCVDVKKCNLKNIGHLEFTFEGESTMMDVRVFSAAVFEGTPSETEEMSPKWFAHTDIPFNDMWPDDCMWFPYMLKDKLFFGKFHYRGHDTILSYEVQELKSMESFYEDKK